MINNIQPSTEAPAETYSRLLLRLHELIRSGEDEGEEGDAIRDEMTTYWYQMSTTEQERMNWLSEDLYTLAEGGVKPKAMSEEEIKEYQAEAKAVFDSNDLDRRLEFLRRPYFESLPPDAVPFLQGMTWSRLGFPDVALVFMREAERKDASVGAMVMHLLDQTGKQDEALVYADRFLESDESSPEEIALAVAIYLNQARHSSNAEQILKKLIPALKRTQQNFFQNSLKAELFLGKSKRELSGWPG